jgi:prevent-host-death family protein
MDTKSTMSITQARKQIFDITDDVQTPGRYYILTEKGRPKAVLLSAEEFESWQETLDIMEQFPNILKDIDDAHRDIRSGRVVPLDDVLRDLGYVARRPRPKSRKKS